MTSPGWYGEPGNASAERYWDGQQWTPQTRPVGANPAQSATFETAKERARKKIAEHPTLCVHDGCMEPRRPGATFCEPHDTARLDQMERLLGPQARVESEQAREYLAASQARLEKAVARSGRFARWAESAERSQRRPGDVKIVCPHCQTQGRVTTRKVKQKKGISGGKAVGAIFTGGASMLATGLSRKEKTTEMHCHNCNTTWYV